jgi:ankyrin repeat protein
VTGFRAAFGAGDLQAVKSMVEEPGEFPNSWIPALRTFPLEYAIYHSPVPFIRELLALGADPNYQHEATFPSLLAALSTEREDRYEIVDLLLGAGAHLHQRGVNDYTPLHYAATRNDARAVELLLARGADPTARTRIDELTTPLEEAERLRHEEVAGILRQAGR